MKRMLRTVLLLAALTGLLVVAGCGGDDEAEAEESATPAAAVQEIDQIKQLLDEALAQYRVGDAETAEETTGDAYLEHFEQVEGPLGEEDHEFMEELEHRISTEIRDEMKNGASVADVEQLSRRRRPTSTRRRGCCRGADRMRRLRLLLLLVALVAVAAPATAAADDEQFAETRAQIAGARTLVEQAVEATRAGDREQGYDLAREAYLDHFELAEVPLRLRDPNLVLDLEFTFAELRNGIRDGAPVVGARGAGGRDQPRAAKVDRVLADPGFAAPLLAFLFSFSILFREGVEAVLLVAILLGSLQAGRASGYRRPLGLGVLAAVIASAITWVLATLVIDIAPLQRELLEGVTAVVAVAVLFVVTFWLVAQLEQRRRVEFMRARVATAIAAGSSLAFAGLGFTAVYREGFETVLFYQALTIFAAGLLEWVLLGIAAAALALAAVGWTMLKLGKRLPVKQLLLGGATMLLLLSVAFAGNAVRSLQEGDWLPVTPIEGGWARLPIFLAELTGIHPTRESIGVQLVLLAVYAAGATWMFLWQPLRRRAAEAASA